MIEKSRHGDKPLHGEVDQDQELIDYLDTEDDDLNEPSAVDVAKAVAAQQNASNRVEKTLNAPNRIDASVVITDKAMAKPNPSKHNAESYRGLPAGTSRRVWVASPKNWLRSPHKSPNLTRNTLRLPKKGWRNICGAPVSKVPQK